MISEWSDKQINKYSFKAEGLHGTEWQAGNFASCVPGWLRTLGTAASGGLNQVSRASEVRGKRLMGTELDTTQGGKAPHSE